MIGETTNVIAIEKPSGERFVFFWDDASRQEMLNTLGRYAGDAELDFDWYDVAHLSRVVRDGVSAE